MDKLPVADLEASSAVPLHRRISDDLRRRIETGELRPGDLLPSENALMRQHGVSRGTVRRALATLRADGTVGGSQGRPLAVRGSHLTQPLSELISFSAWVQSLGRRPSGRVVEFCARPATEELAAMLELPPGASVFSLVRLRLADGEPLMIERTSFTPAVGELLQGVDLNRRSIYGELARRGVVFASARHLIGVMAASDEDAALLGVLAGTPLMRVQRLAFSLSGQPLEWSDDRYLGSVNFAIENTSTFGVVRQLE